MTRLGCYYDRDRITIIFLSFICFFCLVYASPYIDFHADEAIYYNKIAINLDNDVGLFFVVFYKLIGAIVGGVEGARIGSSMLGAMTLYFILSIFKLQDIKGIKKYCFIAAAFLISYQAFFLFDRVRPEASWWFVSSILFYSFVRLETDQNSKFNILLVCISLLLLPMNHRLSWFALIFAAGYIILFLTREIEIKKSAIFMACILCGIFGDFFIRMLILNAPISTIKLFFITPHNDVHISTIGFLKDVFFNAPYFLNDSAANRNIYELVFGVKRWASHHFIQNSYLLFMFILPFFAKNLKTAYIFLFPLTAFIGFYLSGYYNPTYTAGFAIFILMCLVYTALFIKNNILVYCLIGLSIINGLSFLYSRVFSHQEATYYSNLNMIETAISNYQNIKSVAIPERFIPAVRDSKLNKYVLFKDTIPNDVDMMIIDDYDYLMYTFVPNHEIQKQSIYSISSKMCLVYKNNFPVYTDDSIFEQAKGLDTTMTGSWFFRNSVKYNLSIYVGCDYVK